MKKLLLGILASLLLGGGLWTLISAKITSSKYQEKLAEEQYNQLIAGVTPIAASTDFTPMNIDYTKAGEYGLVVNNHYWPNPSVLNPSGGTFTLFEYRLYDSTGNRICQIILYPPQDPEGLWSSRGVNTFEYGVVLKGLGVQPNEYHYYDGITSNSSFLGYDSASWEISGEEGNILDYIQYTEQSLRQNSVCAKVIRNDGLRRFVIADVNSGLIDDPYNAMGLSDKFSIKYAKTIGNLANFGLLLFILLLFLVMLRFKKR